MGRVFLVIDLFPGFPEKYSSQLKQVHHSFIPRIGNEPIDVTFRDTLSFNGMHMDFIEMKRKAEFIPGSSSPSENRSKNVTWG